MQPTNRVKRDLSLRDVLAVLQKAVRGEQRTELANLVPPPCQEPVVAEELVLLHVREHGARERQQVTERLARLLVEQRAVLLGEAVAFLGDQGIWAERVCISP